MREGGRRQPGKPPLPEQMLAAISPVAFTKEEKCGVLQGLKHSALPSPAPRLCVFSEQGRVCPEARAAWAGGQRNKCPPPTIPAPELAGAQFLRVCVGFPAFLITTKYYTSLPSKTL